MQENIIGYLLGALDDDEMARFEAELEFDEELQLRVQDAARGLQILGDSTELEPPPGLVQATFRRVDAVAAPRLSTAHRRELQPTESWSLLDMIVAASVLFISCLLFTPAIQGSRIQAQISACQDNLRQIGQALIGYSLANAKQTFPQIPNDANTGVAGIYASILNDAGFINDDHMYYCPSLTRQDLDETKWRIPRFDEFTKAYGPALAELHAMAGGTYGYTMGYFEGGKLQPVCNENRKNYPICADQLYCESRPNQLQLTHRNVLFEYGGVRTFASNLREWNGDLIFEDLYGRRRAGVNKHDAVISATSSARPLPLYH